VSTTRIIGLSGRGSTGKFGRDYYPAARRRDGPGGNQVRVNTTTSLPQTPTFSLFIPQMRMSFDTIVARVQAAEAHGFDGVSLMDHLAPPGVPATAMYDGFITATLLASRTEHLRICHLVVCDAFRHPAVLAKMAVSLDHLSGGRFDLGIGWGSVPDELRRFDIGNAPSAARSSRLRETLEILEQLFTGEAFDYDGDHFTMRGAQQNPVPVHGHIPIIIGGGGPKLTMPLVARFADWWNCPSYAVEQLPELRPLVGRARVSTQHPVTLAPTARALDDVRALAERRFGNWGGHIVGTPDAVVEQLVAHAQLGVEQFFLPFTDFASPATLELFGREVIPAVRAEVRAAVTTPNPGGSQ
jgi:alkanesulfonate monooxygenase SsuD/methylene tetrahydromethanopterin reductase-like flavin-dependent oxidoreductase (luciferase family)